MQLHQSLHMGEMTAGGRVYLLTDVEGCVLVDTGAPDGTLGAGQLIESAGRRRDEVRLILLTHAHAGHAGNAAGLHELTGAPVAATEAAARELADPPLPRRDLLRRLLAPAEPMPPLRVDRVITPGERIDLCGGIEVIDAPGHAAGAVAFRLALPDALLVGDAATVGAGGLGPPPLRRCVDPQAARRTTAMLGTLDARCLAPGHGLPLVDGRLPRRRRR